MPGPFDPERLPAIHNPLGIEAAQGLLSTLNGVLSAALLLIFASSLTGVVIRFRRARGVERLQLQWFGFAMAVVFLSIVAALVLTDRVPVGITTMIVSVGITTVPIAVGVAILRYRLYDIERLINRSLVYGALTGGLALVYWAAIVILQGLLRPFTGGSDLAIVGSTLVVAAAFQPARRGIQAAVDRRFSRHKYDAQRTLAAFSFRLQDEVDLDSLSADLLGVVQRSMAPAHGSLWLRHGHKKT
jgi:hypothetical protein